jgi:DNA-directed RNA polymerase specialized sigma subunit
LKAFATDYGRREQKIGRAVERLRTDRNKAIRKAYDNGMPMRDIAIVLEISHQRVSQIIRSAEQ